MHWHPQQPTTLTNRIKLSIWLRPPDCIISFQYGQVRQSNVETKINSTISVTVLEAENSPVNKIKGIFTFLLTTDHSQHICGLTNTNSGDGVADYFCDKKNGHAG